MTLYFCLSAQTAKHPASECVDVTVAELHVLEMALGAVNGMASPAYRFAHAHDMTTRHACKRDPAAAVTSKLAYRCGSHVQVGKSWQLQG